MKQTIVANNYPIIIPNGFIPNELRIIEVFCATDVTKSTYAVIQKDGRVVVHGDLLANFSYFISGSYLLT